MTDVKKFVKATQKVAQGSKSQSFGKAGQDLIVDLQKKLAERGIKTIETQKQAA